MPFPGVSSKTLGKNYIKASDDRSGTAYPLPVVTGTLIDVEAAMLENC